MSECPRVVLLTGDGLRHTYVAGRLAEQVRLVGVLCEAKTPAVAKPQDLSEADQAVIDRHFRERDEVERRLLGTVAPAPDAEWKTVSHAAVNSPQVHAWVKHLDPQFVILFGTSIVKPPLLVDFAGRMINIHSGLSPYYRGSGTNFWPLVYGEPECVGTTLHLADAGVDAGPILAQVRPSPAATDRVHELGTKALIAGVELVPRALDAWATAAVKATPQDLTGGTVCRRRDFTAAAVRHVWERFDRGMMADYLNELSSRQQEFPLVTL